MIMHVKYVQSSIYIIPCPLFRYDNDSIRFLLMQIHHFHVKFLNLVKKQSVIHVENISDIFLIIVLLILMMDCIHPSC